MKAKLLITNLNTKDGEFEKVVPPELEILTIGRHPSSYVYLTSAHVSKEHALIIREYDTFYLVDKSSNGTLLNQLRVDREQRNQLKSGDVITVGEYRIVLDIEQAQPKAQARAASVAVPEVVAPPVTAPPVTAPPAKSVAPPTPKPVAPPPTQPAPPPARSYEPYSTDPFEDMDNEPAGTLATFAPTSLEDVIRGLEPGEESSYLVFVGGARDGQRIELRGSTSEIYIGRAANCQVQIQHPAIGQQQAKIRMDWAGITVYDLNSQSGVFINGVRINSSRKLHNGDEISFGVPVSMGGVKLILYDRNSISGDNWVGLPPPITIKNNEKLDDKSATPADKSAIPADKSISPPSSAASIPPPAATASPAKPGDAEKDKDLSQGDIEEDNPAAKSALDLNRVVYNGVTVRDVLFIGALVIVAAIFMVIALSFL